MTHNIAAPDPKGAKTGASGAYGPSWDPDDPQRRVVAALVEAVRMQRPSEAPVDRQARTLTVRFTYLRKGHPRAALEAVLAGISKAVFETEILDEY